MKVVDGLKSKLYWEKLYISDKAEKEAKKSRDH